jgi:RimJ/RimL family protein N-acetyltransferase
MLVKGKIGLRALEKGDLEQLKEWRNIPDFRQNFREYRELNCSDQEAWYDSLQNKKSTDYMFSIVNVESGDLLGACGLLYTNWLARYADFSFYVGYKESYIDLEGIAQASAELLIDYGFNILNLNKLWMELYSFDTRKIDFFKSFGFEIDGVLRENVYHQGAYKDSFILSLLQKDYKSN